MQPNRPERPARPGTEAPAGAGAAPAGRAPSDPQLRTLLRRIINRSATSEALDTAFEALDSHVGEDADLTAQSRSMFQLVLRLGYGTDDARTRAQQWLKDHAPSEPVPAPAQPRRR